MGSARPCEAGRKGSLAPPRERSPARRARPKLWGRGSSYDAYSITGRAAGRNHAASRLKAGAPRGSVHDPQSFRGLSFSRPDNRQGFAPLRARQGLLNSCCKPLAEKYFRTLKASSLPRRYGRCRPAGLQRPATKERHPHQHWIGLIEPRNGSTRAGAFSPCELRTKDPPSTFRHPPGNSTRYAKVPCLEPTPVSRHSKRSLVGVGCLCCALPEGGTDQVQQFQREGDVAR